MYVYIVTTVALLEKRLLMYIIQKERLKQINQKNSVQHATVSKCKGQSPQVWPI